MKVCICSCQCACVCRSPNDCTGKYLVQDYEPGVLRVTSLPSSPLCKAPVRRLLCSDAPTVSAEERVKVLMGLCLPLACRDLRSSGSWGHGAPWAAAQSPATPVPILPPMGNPPWEDCSKAGCGTVLNSYSVTYLKKEYSPTLYWGSQESLPCPPAAQAVVLPVKNSRREGRK